MSSILQMVVVICVSLVSCYSLAAVRCENLFTLNSHRIEAVIQNLASLKIKIEVAKAQGDLSNVITALKHDYKSKEAELRQLTAMTTEQIRVILKNEIIKIQERQQRSPIENDRDPNRDSVLELEKIRLMTPPSYEFVKTSRRLDQTVREGQWEYSSQLNSVAYVDWLDSDRPVVLAEKDTERRTRVGDDVSAFSLSKTNDQLAWILSNSGQLQLVDLKTKKVIKSSELKLRFTMNRDRFYPLDINPAGTRVAIVNDIRLFVFDTTTGELLVKIESSAMYHVLFINDDELFFSGYDGKQEHGFMQKLDLTNLNVKKSPDIDGFIQFFDYNDTTQNLIVTTQKKVLTLSATDFSKISEQPIFAHLQDANASKKFYSPFVKSIPNSFGVFIWSQDLDESYGIFDARAVKIPTTDLASHYSGTGRKILQITFSPDAQQAFVLWRDQQYYRYFDIWKREK